MSEITEIPIEVLDAFTAFCKANGWTVAEIVTLAMLECIKEDTDLVVRVIKQRQLRRSHAKWFLRLPYWPRNSELED